MSTTELHPDLHAHGSHKSELQEVHARTRQNCTHTRGYLSLRAWSIRKRDMSTVSERSKRSSKGPKTEHHADNTWDDYCLVLKGRKGSDKALCVWKKEKVTLLLGGMKLQGWQDRKSARSQGWTRRHCSGRRRKRGCANRRTCIERGGDLCCTRHQSRHRCKKSCIAGLRVPLDSLLAVLLGRYQSVLEMFSLSSASRCDWSKSI